MTGWVLLALWLAPVAEEPPFGGLALVSRLGGLSGVFSSSRSLSSSAGVFSASSIRFRSTSLTASARRFKSSGRA